MLKTIPSTTEQMDLIDNLKEIDTRLFLFLNGKHAESLDPVMFWVSHKFIWIPLYVLLLFFIWKFYGKSTLVIMLVAAALVAASDQISVHFFKDFFMRYRPCHNLNIQSQVHVNGDCGGTYGFISSHAANVFSIATFVWLLLRDHFRFFGLLIFIWAAFVSYSRIYNGVHYPADVVGGAALGILLGSLFWLLCHRIMPKRVCS